MEKPRVLFHSSLHILLNMEKIRPAEAERIFRYA